MKILVTGGAGYIGTHTCVELLEKGYEVVVIDNFCNSSPKAIDRVQQITGKKVVCYNGDVRDGKLLDEIFTSHKIDWVIHFAGLKAVGESGFKPLLYYDNNLCGTIVLSETMQKHNCKKMVFSSSATVYGDPKKLPIDETCPTGGTTNPYGSSKYFQEIMLQDLQKADNGWTVVLLRYFNPVGAHPSGLIGEDPQGIPNNLTPYIAKVAIGQLPEVGVFGNDYDTPDGTGVRDYIHVNDLAQAHILAMEYLRKGNESNIFNLGNGVGFTVKEVVETARKVTGHPIPAKEEPRRAGDPSTLIASSEKAKKILGWKPKFDDLETIITTAWEWHRNHPNGYEA